MVEPKGKLNDADRHAKIKERKMCCKKTIVSGIISNFQKE